MIHVHVEVPVTQSHRQHRAYLVCGIATLGGAKRNVEGAEFHGAIIISTVTVSENGFPMHQVG
jgi:hypothetical protein